MVGDVIMLQQFDIILYKGQSLIAKTIKNISNSKYSHVALVLDSLHTLESDYKNPVNIRHFSYLKGSYDVYEFITPLTRKQRDGILEFIRANIGKGYDYPYILTRGLNILFGTKIYNSPDRYNCDELIVDAFRSEGIELLTGDKLIPETLTQSIHYRLKKSC